MGAPAVTVSAPVPGPGPAGAGEPAGREDSGQSCFRGEMFHPVRASGRDRHSYVQAQSVPQPRPVHFRKLKLATELRGTGCLIWPMACRVLPMARYSEASLPDDTSYWLSATE